MLENLKSLSLSELQISGGDDRLVLDPKTGCNKYNTPNRPRPEAICRSSTTSNVVSLRGYNAASAVLASLLTSSSDAMLQDTFQNSMDDVRSRISACYQLPQHIDVALAPSGSDAEFLPLLVALSRRPAGGTLNIVTAAGEVGSGTANACRGCHFSSVLPSGAASKNGAPSAMPGAGTDFMQTKEVLLRARGGGLRPASEVESEVETLVKVAIDEGRIPLVHIVVGSKTGATTPSEKFVRDLQHHVGAEKMIVIVDACQGRVKENKIGEWLQEGWQVLVTGSKFFGAPPFCGAVLMQEEQMQALESMSVEFEALGDYFDRVCFKKAARAMQSCRCLPDRMNFGLLLRWEAALIEMECFYGTDEAKRSHVMKQWVQGAKELVETHGESCGHLKLALQGEADTEGIALGGVNSLLGFEVLVGAAEEKKALNVDQLKKFHAMMPRDLSQSLSHTSHEISEEDLAVLKRPCYIGQPVKLSSDVTVIRFAADAPLVNNVCTSKDDVAALQRVLADDEILVKKLVLLARFWDDLVSEDSKSSSSSSKF
mmetsp:Transcript_112651/g.194732  ORF Transcript_112651/g.194732 Transcript_112651/m.194732 type:complete len:542 (+) Transcript_112651:3-1628(+)